MITDDFIIESIDRPLKTALVALKPDFVKLAQWEYDHWQGSYGLCADIEKKIRYRIDNKIDAKTSQQSKNSLHYWTRVCAGNECYDIDIPFGKYETYNYKTKKYEKIPNVIFTTRDIFIYRSTHSSLKTPWDLKKSYVPNKSDKYYTSESLDLSLVTVKSKKSPIIRNGWLLPDGKFIPLSIYIRSHNELAKQMGFAGYYDAYDYGCVRVSIMPSGKYYMETTQPMNDKLYSLLTTAIKRMKDVVDVSIWVGDGASFQKFEWDGRQIVSSKNRVYESPDFNYSKFNDRDEAVSKIIFSQTGKEYAHEQHKTSYHTINANFMRKGNIVGSINLFLVPKDLIVIVESIEIKHTWFGTGLGQTLYDKAIQYAKEAGFKYLDSDTNRSTAANRAWLKLSQRYPITFEKIKIRGRLKDHFRVDLAKLSLKESIITEEPDFGYRQFNNRDEDIAKLRWIVDAEKSMD